MLTKLVGYLIVLSTDNCIAPCDLAAYHHPFISHVTPVRPSTKTLAFQPEYTEEDRCHPIPPSFGLSGDSPACMAQNQSLADE